MCVLKMSPLPSTGWPLGVYYSEYEMLAPLRGLLIRMAFSELASLVLILIAVAVVSRRITRPLTELVSITDNVAAGHLDAPMPRVRNQDEVGRLITSFGSMQEKLKQHIAQLEQETASRNRLQGELMRPPRYNCPCFQTAAGLTCRNHGISYGRRNGRQNPWVETCTATTCARTMSC